MKEKYKANLGTGASSILMIFVVLCMTTFGILSLVSARADLNLTKANEKAVANYYKADAQAEQELCALDQALTDCRRLADLAAGGADVQRLIQESGDSSVDFLAGQDTLRPQLENISGQGLSGESYAQAVYLCFAAYAVQAADGTAEQSDGTLTAVFTFPVSDTRPLQLRVRINPLTETVRYEVLSRGMPEGYSEDEDGQQLNVWKG